MAEPVMGTEEDVILSRVAALVIDEIVAVGLAAVSGAIIVGPLRSPVLAFLVACTVLLGYHVVLEGLYGQTVGKRALGIVVRRNGDPCTMLASFVRNGLRLVDEFAHHAVALVATLTNDERQRMGDVAAATVVVRAR